MRVFGPTGFPAAAQHERCAAVEGLVAGVGAGGTEARAARVSLYPEAPALQQVNSLRCDARSVLPVYYTRACCPAAGGGGCARCRQHHVGGLQGCGHVSRLPR